MKLRFLCICGLMLLISCSKRNLVYLSDLGEQENQLGKISDFSPVIQPNDLLEISLQSLSPEHNALFNGTIVQTGGRSNASTSPATGNEYVVDKFGEVNLLVLGKVQLGGLTKEEAEHKLTFLLQEYVKDPIVNIKFLNFKVTVIGEVNNPSTFALPTERVSILEVLGYAGDLTALGKRENVLVIREANGERSSGRINLNSKEIFDSPYFYLQQNDVVYVEPDKMKAAQSSMNRMNISLALSVASLLVLIATRLF